MNRQSLFPTFTQSLFVLANKVDKRLKQGKQETEVVTSSQLLSADNSICMRRLGPVCNPVLDLIAQQYTLCLAQLSKVNGCY